MLFRSIEDNGVDFQIQCLPDNNYENLVVPVGLVAVKGATVTFKATSFNLPSEIKVYREDKIEVKVTLLDGSNSYVVTLGADSKGAGRFYLKTTKLISAAPGDLTAELQVIPLAQQQIIRVLERLVCPHVPKSTT